jgi:hypothetical protein
MKSIKLVLAGSAIAAVLSTAPGLATSPAEAKQWTKTKPPSRFLVTVPERPGSRRFRNPPSLLCLSRNPKRAGRKKHRSKALQQFDSGRASHLPIVDRSDRDPIRAVYSVLRITR